MPEYITTEDECQKRRDGLCCLRCGGSLSPIETVNNSRQPTFWAGCTNCGIFSSGTTNEVYALAKELSIDYHHITMDDLCSIIKRIKRPR